MAGERAVLTWSRPDDGNDVLFVPQSPQASGPTARSYPTFFTKRLSETDSILFSLNDPQLDANHAYSAMSWWEPRGDFGQGFSDFEYHRSAVVRLGHAFTYARQGGERLGEPQAEQTFVRISDGTRLAETGALAPDVTVKEFDLALYTVHTGLKRRGFSFAAEHFFRWIRHIRADGPIPVESLFDYGFMIQAGQFVVPQCVELYARGSAVYGSYGDGTEIGGGLNWFPKRTPNWRFTFDVTRLYDSPAEQNQAGLVAGASGTLFRVQFWTLF